MELNEADEMGVDLDSIHFEALYISLKEILDSFTKFHSDSQMKMSMTKLITVYKRFLSSKLKLQEYDEDLYPEDHQNMCSYIQDFEELLQSSKKNWTKEMKKEYFLSSQDDYLYFEESSENENESIQRNIFEEDSMDNRVLKLQNTAFLLAKETRKNALDQSQISDTEKSIGLSAVDTDELNYLSFMKAREPKKLECCSVF